MADNLTDVAESEALKWIVGQAATGPVLPLRCRLMSANGTDATAGTEITGDTYTAKDVTVAAVAGGATSNDTLLSWTSLDSATQKTVVGVEIWDSATTPVRWWHGALAADKIVNAGDPFEIPVGDLDLSLG